MKRNYWPLFFIGIFSFVFSMIVWTVKSAVSSPVIEDKSFMKKYQDLDDDYNGIMTSNDKFLSKYDFELSFNDNKFGLTTEDIKFSQRVIEKSSQHKNVLKVGPNSIKVTVTDKITKIKKDVTIELTISKATSNDGELVLRNENFQDIDKTYNSTFGIKDENNWIITGSFTVDDTKGYVYIKTNAI